MKFESYSLYNPNHVALAEKAFLTVWNGLGSWHEDLVLIGGLVPKYICGDITSSRELPRPVTLDADLGIALGASIGQYGSLQMDLQAQGFSQTKDETGGPRFIKVINDVTIPVDFLTESPPLTKGTVIVDTIPASILPGIDRALATARKIKIKGVDLLDVEQNCTVRVCEVGPFLALKLRAFYSRQQPKDAFDILYTLRHYDQGNQAAAKAFAEEVHLANPACKDALASLERDFTSENASAPVRAAHFILGQAATGESEDIRFRRKQIQQDVVEAARLLKASLK
jgi:hypothetical protein